MLDNKKYEINLKSQRKRLMEWLKGGPITTLEARRELDILMPAARIYELRHQYGYNIVKCWLRRQTEHGVYHRVAQYSLKIGKWGEDNDQ